MGTVMTSFINRERNRISDVIDRISSQDEHPYTMMTEAERTSARNTGMWCLIAYEVNHHGYKEQTCERAIPTIQDTLSKLVCVKSYKGVRVQSYINLLCESMKREKNPSNYAFTTATYFGVLLDYHEFSLYNTANYAIENGYGLWDVDNIAHANEDGIYFGYNQFEELNQLLSDHRLVDFVIQNKDVDVREELYVQWGIGKYKQARGFMI